MSVYSGTSLFRASDYIRVPDTPGRVDGTRKVYLGSDEVLFTLHHTDIIILSPPALALRDFSSSSTALLVGLKTMIHPPNCFALPCAGPFHKINAGYEATTTTTSCRLLFRRHFTKLHVTRDQGVARACLRFIREPYTTE